MIESVICEINRYRSNKFCLMRRNKNGRKSMDWQIHCSEQLRIDSLTSIRNQLQMECDSIFIKIFFSSASCYLLCAILFNFLGSFGTCLQIKHMQSNSIPSKVCLVYASQFARIEYVSWLI